MEEKTWGDLGVEAIKEDEETYVLAEKLRPWLIETGLYDALNSILELYGALNVCVGDQPIPHPVHFREGMVIRNKLRTLTNFGWTDRQYDNRWEDITIIALTTVE